MNTLTQITAFLVVVALSSSSVVQSPGTKGNTFELLILHNNDMHARFEQTSQLSGTCTAADREAGKCYGGFPRVAYVVKEARKAAANGEGPPVLYLNAGDTYTGTAWFTIYKWKIAAEFVNALQPDAVSIGNNDLKRGSNEVSPLLSNINAPILATNVILKNGETYPNLHKSIIMDVEGTKVGIIGYLTLESNLLDSTDNIEYIDEVIAMKEEVEKLQAQNVNIIIALGHSNVDKNTEIANEVDGVDLVISGHKNTFFWNGKTTNADLPQTAEPRFITQKSGKQVLILESYSYDTYLGNILVKFNDNGDIVNYNAKPILLDDSIPQDAKTFQTLTDLSDELRKSSSEVVGQTAVVLDGTTCKTAECNLGNLVTDAMKYYYAVRYNGATWSDAPIAIIHSGAIASSIAPSNRPASVTRGDLLSAMPSESSIFAVNMTGTVLLQVLEQSVAEYSIERPTGNFLQFSGIRAVYNMSQEPGSRLVSAVVRCWSCHVPEFFSIDDWRYYNVLMPAALANGEYGYSMLEGLPKQEVGYDEVTCLADYISLRSPVYPEVAERILLNGLDSFIEPEPSSATAITSTLIIMLFCTLIVLFN